MLLDSCSVSFLKTCTFFPITVDELILEFLKLVYYGMNADLLEIFPLIISKSLDSLLFEP